MVRVGAVWLVCLAGCVGAGALDQRGPRDDGGEGSADDPADPPGDAPWGAASEAGAPSDEPTTLADGGSCFEGAFTPFWGDLHVHLADHETPTVCEYSAEAVLAEAQARGLGFIGVTEHVWRTTAGELSTCKEAALASVTESFRPHCGFETNVVMADGSYSGHANALWAPSNHNTDAADADGEDFAGASGKQNLYAFIDDGDAVGQINHPNHEEDGWPDRAARHASGAMDLVEMSGSCGGCADRDAAALATYLALLDAGWRLGPSMNSDTHCMKPGRRTGLWVANSIVKAGLRNHRSFVQSYDPPAGEDNQLALFMRADDADGTTRACWMGSSLARPAGDAVLRIRLRGHMVTAGAPGSVTMQVLAHGAGGDAPLATAVCGAGSACTCDAGTCTWEPEVPAAGTDWLVARAASEVDGNPRWAVSSPLWLADP